MKHIIISLGELIKSNFENSAKALIEITLKKLGSQANLNEVVSKLTKIFNQKDQVEKIIDKFKLGEITESVFDESFITSIHDELHIDINPQEFTQAWLTAYDDTKLDLLTQLVEKNSNEIQFHIVSYTNPKDIKYLSQLFKDNGFEIKTDKSLMDSINDISVDMTFDQFKNKMQLDEKILKDLGRQKAISFQEKLKPQQDEVIIINAKVDLSKHQRQTQQKIEQSFVDQVHDKIQTDIKQDITQIGYLHEEYNYRDYTWNKDQFVTIEEMITDLNNQLHISGL